MRLSAVRGYRLTGLTLLLLRRITHSTPLPVPLLFWTLHSRVSLLAGGRCCHISLTCPTRLHSLIHLHSHLHLIRI